ncbi:hypothetical protein F5880DRAFT_1511253 [Lentinula raphanica]|nr:hypothetical protein F5880DRAFT_1511253 [Lentinula raphanica]
MAPGSHPPGLPSFTFTDITPTWPTVNARRIDRIWPSIPDWNFDAKFSVSPNNIIKGPLCYQTQSMIVLRYGVFKSHSMGFAVFEFAIMDHARTLQVPVPVLEQQNEGDHESLTFFQAPILQIFSDPSRFLYTTATSEQQSNGYDRFVGATAHRMSENAIIEPWEQHGIVFASLRLVLCGSTLLSLSTIDRQFSVKRTGESRRRIRSFKGKLLKEDNSSTQGPQPMDIASDRPDGALSPFASDSLPLPALTRLGKVSENTGWASKLRHTLEVGRFRHEPALGPTFLVVDFSGLKH